jgi:hypothetical protein
MYANFSKTEIKETSARDGKEVAGKSKDRQKGNESKVDGERADKERKPDSHGRDKKQALPDGVKEVKQEEREEKVRSLIDKGRDVDERTKDRSHRSDAERNDGTERVRTSDRDYDQHQSSSSADGTPASHHSNDGHRRSAEVGKQTDERGKLMLPTSRIVFVILDFHFILCLKPQKHFLYCLWQLIFAIFDDYFVKGMSKFSQRKTDR